MKEALKTSQGSSKTRFLFVIGTGRSGTHFLGRIIGKHPGIEFLLEDTTTFNMVKKAAIMEPMLKNFKKLFHEYSRIKDSSDKAFVLEKSHPNIWITDALISYFPDSFFVGVQRDVFQVVNSMLKHKGVLKWFDTLPDDRPSQFLGINQKNLFYYKDLPLEAKCTLRWLSHTYELASLKKKYPESVMLLDYQDLCSDFDKQVHKLEELVGLDLMKYAEKPNLESLTKYKDLSASQISIVEETLAREADFFKS